MSERNSWIEYLLMAQDNPEDGPVDISPLSDELRQRFARQARLFTEEMPGGFLIYRAGGGEELLYANRAVMRMFGCRTMEELRALTGNSFRGMVHPDDLEAVESSIETQIEQSRHDLDYVEYRIRRRDGQTRWVEDFGHFVRSTTEGDLFYVFIGDATEKQRRQQEERTRLLQEKLQQEKLLLSQIETYNAELERANQEQLQRLELIEGLSIDYESIFYVDLNTDQIQPYRIGRRIEHQFKNDGEVLRLQKFAAAYLEEWVHPEDRAVFLQALSPDYIRAALQSRMSFHTNYRVVVDGRIEHLQIFIANVGKTDQVSQILFGCRSVDDEIRHELEQNQLLEAALTQAKAANTVKNTFLSNMSHDIRTPMNAIMGFTALARRHMGEPEKLRGYLDTIQTASSELLQLMDDVLEISRLESGSLHSEEVPCSLLDIAQDIQKEILPKADTKGITFSASLSGLVHHAVWTDREKLTQVLLRLAGNAVKYTEYGGLITVTFTELNASLRFAVYQFTVEDNGIGISESFLPRMFEPFERQQNTTLSGVSGTGLGLPIAKSTVEMMGGTIDVQSTAGKGSRFTVNLSLRLQETPQAVESTALPRSQSSTRRILLVEDNEINLEIEVELLEESGFLVETAVDGSIAVEKVKDSSPGYYALVLMDIQMPVMDGHSAARAIRALDNPALASIPIVALSANAFEEDRRQSVESGMDAHMAKPVDIDRLLEMLNQITG